MEQSLGQAVGTGAVPTVEEALVIRAQGGDAAAFAEIFERYQHRIINYIYGLVHDRELANDLAQELRIDLLVGDGGNREAAVFHRTVHDRIVRQRRIARRDSPDGHRSAHGRAGGQKGDTRRCRRGMQKAPARHSLFKQFFRHQFFAPLRDALCAA